MKHVDRDASSIAFMIFSTVISRDDYLSQRKTKKSDSTKAEVVVEECTDDETENANSEG